MKGRIIQSAKLYLQKEGEEKIRHIANWDKAYVPICDELGITTDFKNRTFLIDLPPEVEPKIKKWPENESQTIWANAKMLWAGNFNVDKVLTAGFNLALGGEWYVNEKFMDECAEKGLGIVFNIWDPLSRNNIDRSIELVKKWKDHPAVFAWYFLDEPELKEHATPARQMEWRQAIKAVDPDHELFAVFTSNPNHPYRNYNPDAFDHCGVDVYPFSPERHKPEWGGDWRKLLYYCADHWNSETGNIGGMAVLQAYHNVSQGMDKPNGYIAEMLSIFRKHAIGTEDYGMYCWTDGLGEASVGISEDQELLKEVTKLNKEE